MSNDAPAPQPLMMVAPFDPVEALLTDLVSEIQSAIQEKSDGKFWSLVWVHFIETSIFSFDTSYDSLIEEIQKSREQSDYFVRFCTRLIAKSYYAEAMESVFNSFSAQCKWSSCVSENLLKEYAVNDVAKILIMVSVYKPQITTVLVREVA